ncbi:MAG: hypothetical protein K2Q01_02390 [Rickettsiales bacterium]|nr:hypothetical protein [Rickettsiales bacterium]
MAPQKPTEGKLSEMLAVTGKAGKLSLVQKYLGRDAEAAREMERQLGDMGFRYFRFLGVGNFSLALHTVDDQVVRIFAKQPTTEDRPVHPAILQPIAVRQFTVGEREYVIEVLPRVRTNRIGWGDARRVKKALEESGIRVFDVKREGNIGYVRVDGKDIPVLVDAGEAKYLPDYEKRKTRTAHLKPWLSADGIWLQHKADGRTMPSGVVNGEELANVEWGTGYYAGRPEGQTAGAIRDDGFYVAQVETMYARALEKLERSPNANFSELLKAERETIKRER